MERSILTCACNREERRGGTMLHLKRKVTLTTYRKRTQVFHQNGPESRRLDSLTGETFCRWRWTLQLEALHLLLCNSSSQRSCNRFSQRCEYVHGGALALFTSVRSVHACVCVCVFAWKASALRHYSQYGIHTAPLVLRDLPMGLPEVHLAIRGSDDCYVIIK